MLSKKEMADIREIAKLLTKQCEETNTVLSKTQLADLTYPLAAKFKTLKNKDMESFVKEEFKNYISK